MKPQITAPEGGWQVASSREDAWIETLDRSLVYTAVTVASSREDAWIETLMRLFKASSTGSRPPARTRGLKPYGVRAVRASLVASSREDAWIETFRAEKIKQRMRVASSREDAWIETLLHRLVAAPCRRVLPRGRVD